MALIPTPNLDYTDRDQDSLVARLRNVIRSVWPHWTDEKVANFGNLLIELDSFGYDIQAFMIDALARESRIVTATQRKALLALGKLTNFEPKTTSAATVSVDFSIATAISNDIPISAGEIVRTKAITGSLEFRLLTDITLPLGQTSVSAAVKHSEVITDAFTSDGTPNQVFRVSRAGYIDLSMSITADNGAYSEVQSFLNSTPTDLHYTVEVDEFDIAIIRMPAGDLGAVPIGGMSVSYEIGGGEAGNVQAEDISIIPGTIRDTSGAIVTLSVSNPLNASGGADRESEASIRQRAPETLRVLNRSIAREDFEIVAEAVTGVARALMLSTNEDPAVAENSGHLFIVPEGGGQPSSTLRQTVLDQFEGTDPPYEKPLGFLIIDFPPLYKPLAIRAVVYLQPNAVGATVRATVNTNLTNFFALRDSEGAKNTNVGFGFDYKDADGVADPRIALSDIFNVVRDSTGVRRMGDLESDFTVEGLHRDVILELHEFPTYGSLILVDGATGNTL
jgi:hypothetical protein